MQWSRERVLILVSAAIFLLFGSWLFAVPTALEGIGIQLTSAAAITDVRAIYGGLELGLAAFLLVAQARPAWHRASLLLLACAIGGFAVGRLGGIILAGTGSPLMWGLLAIEAAAAAVMAWAYRAASSP